MSLVKARQSREVEPMESEPTDGLGRKLRCYFPGCQERWSVWIEKGYCSFHQWGKGLHAPQKESIATREIKAALEKHRSRA